jgi:hypothetical protein
MADKHLHQPMVCYTMVLSAKFSLQGVQSSISIASLLPAEMSIRHDKGWTSDMLMNGLPFLKSCINEEDVANIVPKATIIILVSLRISFPYVWRSGRIHKGPVWSGPGNTPTQLDLALRLIIFCRWCRVGMLLVRCIFHSCFRVHGISSPAWIWWFPVWWFNFLGVLNSIELLDGGYISPFG